ncbi:aldehyde dehydrogenase, partial [Streptomyces goshikiensis]
PSFLVSHELSLDEASAAYEHFDNRDDGWTKVVLHPNGSNGSSRRVSASKRGSRSAGDNSSRQTLEELRREAKAQSIEGRSHMNKEQLRQALKH